MPLQPRGLCDGVTVPPSETTTYLLCLNSGISSERRGGVGYMTGTFVLVKIARMTSCSSPNTMAASSLLTFSFPHLRPFVRGIQMCTFGRISLEAGQSGCVPATREIISWRGTTLSARDSTPANQRPSSVRLLLLVSTLTGGHIEPRLLIILRSYSEILVLE